MFRKIILGYTYSPSLGDELLAFEKGLVKKARWQRRAIVALLILLFLTAINGGTKIEAPAAPIEKIESSKNLKLESEILSSESLISQNSHFILQLKIKNISAEPIFSNFEFQISDILEYARVVETSDSPKISGDFASWRETEIPPNETKIKQVEFVAQENFSAAAQNRKIANSYDCEISTFFGNLASKNVVCPQIKQFESLYNFQTNIPFGAVIAFYVVLIFVTAISYRRTILLLKHLILIKGEK